MRDTLAARSSPRLESFNPEREDAKDPPQMDDNFFVYILTNKWRNVLYTGLTDSLESRLAQHKDKVFDGFTKKYNCDKLVYFEIHDNVDVAAVREKQIKGWTRRKKDALVATLNPEWNDLSANWADIRRGSFASLRINGYQAGDPSLRSGLISFGRC
jgi:putative endonuclease